jgi:hypothetical protein
MSKDKSPSYYLHSFLLDIIYALIAYKKSNDLHVLAEHFITACRKDTEPDQREYDSKVRMLLESTYILSSQLSMLDCCPAHDAGYEDETRHDVEQYMPGVIDYVDSCNISSRLSVFAPLFQDDYAVTYQRLIHNEIDLLQAEKSILCWQGAISDDALQEAVFLMRYSYLKHLL